MADNVDNAQAPASPGKGWLWKIILYGGVVLAAAIAALLVFLFVIRPMFSAGEEKDPDFVAEPKIAATIVTIEFEQTFASILMPDNAPSSTLLYQVAMECNNQIAADLVTKNMPRFVDMIGELHRNRTRNELDDPLVVAGIKKQAVQEANKILRRLQEEIDPEVRVNEVFHKQFYIQDL